MVGVTVASVERGVELGGAVLNPGAALVAAGSVVFILEEGIVVGIGVVLSFSVASSDAALATVEATKAGLGGVELDPVVSLSLRLLEAVVFTSETGSAIVIPSTSDT